MSANGQVMNTIVKRDKLGATTLQQHEIALGKLAMKGRKK